MKPERLLVPFAAITTFHDPSVQFGLKFDPTEKEGQEPEGEAAPAAADAAAVPPAIVVLPDCAAPIEPAASAAPVSAPVCRKCLRCMLCTLALQCRRGRTAGMLER